MGAHSEIEALGYVILEVSDVQAWMAFASGLLGLASFPRTNGEVDLRMDDYATRIRITPGPRDDLVCAGWEVRDAKALASLKARLEAAEVIVETLDSACCADRYVAEAIRFSDPEGAVLEAYYGPLQRSEVPAVSPLGVRFKTGRQGLGHIVLSCADKAAMMAFYQDLLGFRISDHIRTEVVPGRQLDLTFMRCNGRHHSLALSSLPPRKKIAHLMVEVLDIDDVGRAMYRCLDAGVHLSMTLGRHSNDNMLSFYLLTPSGFDIEFGWGGLEVDDETWHVLTHRANSAWGHRFQRPPKPAP